MDYQGTPNNDSLEQSALNLPDWVNIYGGHGNDIIKIGTANAIGGPGDDLIIGTTAWSTAVYWDSTDGIGADLKTGVVHDGMNGIDTLQNVHVIQGTVHSDSFMGSDENDTFWSNGGSDNILGGEGIDTVIYYNLDKSDIFIGNAEANGSYTVKKGENGSIGMDFLSGIEKISLVSAQTQSETIWLKNLRPQDIEAPSLLMVTHDNEDFSIGDYTAQNNVWPDGTINNQLVNTKDYWQKIAFQSNDLQRNVEISWSYPNIQPPNYIYSMPSITWGAGENGLLNNAKSVRISDLSNLIVAYDFDMRGQTDSFNVTLELYTYSKPMNENGATKLSEIMLKIHQPWSEGPEVPYSDSYIDALQTIRYEIIGAVIDKPNLPKWTFASYKLKNDVSSGIVDYANLLNDLVRKGVIESDQYIAGIEFGCEVTKGFGGLDIKYFGVAKTTNSDDIIDGLSVNSVLNGGAGLDLVVYKEPYNNYKLVNNFSTSVSIHSSTYSNTLTNIERLQFSDKKVALDVTENALETLQFIGVIAPSLQGNLNIRSTILSLFDQGKTMLEMSQLALDLGLITSDNTDLAKTVFKNVFNTSADPDQDLTNQLVNYIEKNGDANFLATVAGLNLNVDLVGLQQHGMEFL